MMRKIPLILVLFSVSCTHAAADESNTLKLYPLTYPLTESGDKDCTFQLKGTKGSKIEHFAQIGVCYSHDANGRPADLKDCTAVSVININKNKMILRQISYGGPESALYKNDDYVVEIKVKERDCEKVSCKNFIYDGVLTVKKGSLQQTFDMQGSCDFGDEG